MHECIYTSLPTLGSKIMNVTYLQLLTLKMGIVEVEHRIVEVLWEILLTIPNLKLLEVHTP